MRIEPMLRVFPWIAVSCALGACEPAEPAPFVPERDGAVDRPDVGPILVRIDGGQDGGSIDADVLDGSALDGGDGGRPPPRVDGVLSAMEWDGAIEATSMTTPTSAFPSDRLSRLLVIRTSDRLYVAIAGSIGSGNAMLMLVDADYGSANGTLLAGTGLDDFAGDLDRALSAPIWGTALAELRPEYAWGTLVIPFARTGADERTGWREIASRPMDFQRIGAGAVSQCTTTVCETSIVLGAGGIERASELAIVVRTGNTFGDLSNQTLPSDAPAMPETITRVLRIPPL